MSRYFIIFYGVVIIMIMNTAAGVVCDSQHSLERCALSRRLATADFPADRYSFGRALYPDGDASVLLALHSWALSPPK